MSTSVDGLHCGSRRMTSLAARLAVSELAVSELALSQLASSRGMRETLYRVAPNQAEAAQGDRVQGPTQG
jgi:hypothetical protein